MLRPPDSIPAYDHIAPLTAEGEAGIRAHFREFVHFEWLPYEGA